jgi:hypothetical protein
MGKRRCVAFRVSEELKLRKADKRIVNGVVCLRSSHADIGD